MNIEPTLDYVGEPIDLNLLKLDTVKTAHAKHLYEQAFKCWYEQTRAEQLTVPSLVDEIAYNINSFISYKKQRIKMESLKSDIGFWLKRPYAEFKDYIRELDIVHERLKHRKAIEVVFESSYLKIITPLTWSACRKYGAGTKWCITNNTTAAYWDLYYSDKQQIFYFLPTDPNLPKTIVYTKTYVEHITDQEDNNMTIQQFFNILANVYQMKYLDIIKWIELQSTGKLNMLSRCLYFGFSLFVIKKTFLKIFT
jgi:hypothetical protein